MYFSNSRCLTPDPHGVPRRLIDVQGLIPEKDKLRFNPLSPTVDGSIFTWNLYL